MSDSSKPTGDLFDELLALGGNVTRLLRATWRDSGPERRRFQGELETALTDLTNTLNRAGLEFLVSPTGQRVQSELNNVRERIRRGGLEAAAYEELTALLQRLNGELTRAADKANPKTDGEA